jgi:hypothetical protein
VAERQVAVGLPSEVERARRSNVRGSGKARSSKLAEPHQSVTLSPVAISRPPTCASRVAVRRLYVVDDAHRSTSSVALGRSERSASRAAQSAGRSDRAWAPTAIELRVVSEPAASSRLKNICSSSDDTGRSAPIRVESRSSPGRARLSAMSACPYSYISAAAVTLASLISPSSRSS